MKLQYDPDEKSPNKWYVSTNDGGIDAAGPTPLDAVSALVELLERDRYTWVEADKRARDKEEARRG